MPALAAARASLMACLLLLGCAPLQQQGAHTPPVSEALSGSVATEIAVDSLLEEANRAFRDNRLTTPEYDNALQRYQQILQRTPEGSHYHRAAQLGVLAIGERYAEFASRASLEGREAAARRYAKLARQYNPDVRLYLPGPAAKTLVSRKPAGDSNNTAAGAGPAPAEPVALPAATVRHYVLNINALQQRSDWMRAYLQQLALRVQQQDSRILITARSDADGRWIYQQMRAGLSDYRLRANLQRGSAASVLLLDEPPADAL